MMVYGPVAPKGSKVENGKTIVSVKYQGPVRPGTDVEKFRKTGVSVRAGGKSIDPQVAAQQAAEEKAEIQRQAEQQKIQAQQEAQRQAEQQKIQAQQQAARKIQEQIQQKKESYENELRRSQHRKTIAESSEFLRRKNVPEPIIQVGEKTSSFGMGVYEKGRGALKRISSAPKGYDSTRGKKFQESLLGKPIPEEERGIISPKGVRGIFTKGGELTLKGGEILEKATKKTGLIKERSLLTTPLPVKRSDVAKTIGDVYMFSGFAPLMAPTAQAATAARQRSFLEFEKQIVKPKSSVVTLEEQYVKQQATKKIYSPSAKIRTSDGKRFLKFKQTPKEKIELTIKKPTGIWKGEVEEVRDIGVFRKPKTFKGEVIIKDNIYKETIKYPKQITKVTKIKSGEGRVDIYKKGKLQSTFDIGSDVRPDIKFKQLKSDKIFEKQMGGGGTEKSVTSKGMGVIDIKNPKIDLKSRALRMESKGSAKYGEDISKGIKQRVETRQDVFDIIQAGPEEQIFSIKEGGKSILYKKRVGQKIMYGDEKDLLKTDLAGFEDIGGRKSLIKQTGSKIKRSIIQEQKRRITTTYNTPEKNVFEPTMDIKPFEKMKPIIDKQRGIATDAKIKSFDIGDNLKLIQKKEDILYVKSPSQYLKSTKLKIPDVQIGTGVDVSKKSKIDISALSSFKKPKVVGSQKQITVPQAIQIQKSAPTTLSKNLTQTMTKQESIQKTRTIQRPIQKTQQESIQKTRTIQIAKQLPAVKQKQRLGTLTAQKQSLKAGRSLNQSPFLNRPTEKRKKRLPPIKLPKASYAERKKKIYGIEIRRGGKFFNIGTTRDLNKALAIGRSATGKTLARSFRIKGVGADVKLPKGYTISKTLGKDVVVEKSKLALNTGEELSEIRGYKSTTKKKKASKKRSKRAVSNKKKKK